MMRLTFGCLLCFASVLSAQLKPPQAGLIRNADGTVHALFGISQSLIQGPGIGSDALALSFVQDLGIAASANEVKILNSSGTVLAAKHFDQGPALVSSGDQAGTAVVWFPASGQVWRFANNTFTTCTLDASLLGGNVVSISLPSKSSARFLVGTGSTLSIAAIALPVCNVTSSDNIASSGAKAFLINGYFLSMSEEGLVIDKSGAMRRILPFPQTEWPGLTAERMSKDWIHLLPRLSSAGHSSGWALHLTDSEAELSLIPAPKAGQGEARP